MDKIFSTRIEESVVNLIDSLSKRLHTSKKKVLEEAVRDYALKTGVDGSADVFRETSGAWKRKESPDAIRSVIKKRFSGSMTRRHR